MFRRVADHADLILCPSESAARDIMRHMTDLPRKPPVRPVHLGVDLVAPAPLIGFAPADPYFVTLGTIEPRKNHALLLDVWQSLGPDAPQLYICGARGWNNVEVFARLDAGVPGVTELPGLPDAQLATLIAGARALLFPSLAEGFGLPPVEAAARGTPVVCGDLAVTREILGEIPVYLDATMPELWKKEIIGLAEASPRLHGPDYAPPTWDSHFKTVLSLT
jgi:glycosyltransferase involved in cell wall biosynthesis